MTTSMRIVLCCGILLSAFICPSLSATWQEEQTLKTAILTGYDSTIRPSSPLPITWNFVFFSLNDLNIANQEMALSGVIHLKWNDTRLTWDPNSYASIESIVLPYGSFWTPPMIVENSKDQIAYIGSNSQIEARVSSTGVVKWMLPMVLSVTCEMQVLKFPFDSQSCGILMYTWAYDQSELYMESSTMFMMDYYTQNGEWDFTGFESSLQNVTDGEEIYIKKTVVLNFKRKWLFIGLSYIIPSVLNSVLMCLVFALSIESGEKLGYALTVLLTYTVLLTLVSDSLPPISNDISALQIYLTTVMCFGVIATILTVWTVTVYNQDPEKPRPEWALKLCHHVLTPLTCQNKCWQKGNQENAKRNAVTPMQTGQQEAAVSQEDLTELGRYGNRKGSDKPPAYYSRSNLMTDREQNGEPEDEVQDMSWQEMAGLMDAVFLRAVCSLIGLSTFVLIVFYMAIY